MKYADFDFNNPIKRPGRFICPGCFLSYKGRTQVKGGFGALEFLDKPV